MNRRDFLLRLRPSIATAIIKGCTRIYVHRALAYGLTLNSTITVGIVFGAIHCSYVSVVSYHVYSNNKKRVDFILIIFWVFNLFLNNFFEDMPVKERKLFHCLTFFCFVCFKWILNRLQLHSNMFIHTSINEICVAF